MAPTPGDSRRTLWVVGLVVSPFWAGALALALLADVRLGLLVLTGLCLWAASLLTMRSAFRRGGEGAMTCRGSGSPDPARRGLPGADVPRPRMSQAPRAVSPSRLRLQQGLDTAALFGLAALYILTPALFPLALCWALVIWWVVIRPNRHHPLVHRLHRWCLPALVPAPASAGTPEARLQANAARARARCIPIACLKHRLSGHDGLG